jgi:hypothetical protein
MSAANKLELTTTRNEMLEWGYVPCMHCNPEKTAANPLPLQTSGIKPGFWYQNSRIWQGVFGESK